MSSAALHGVKAFANLAGVTVRTLQFYDQAGLLKPSHYTEARHRLYSNGDLLRLQQILTLKSMGFSLEEIRQLLDSPVYDLRMSLQIQKEALDQRIAQLQKASQALGQTLATLASAEAEELDWALVSEIIHGTLVAEKWQWVTRYYTPAQQQMLEERRQHMSPREVVAGRKAWAELMVAFDRWRTQGVPAADLRVQKLAAKMEALIADFTQGDAGLRQSLAAMYRDLEQRPAEEQPFDLELRRYMQAALEVYHRTTDDR